MTYSAVICVLFCVKLNYRGIIDMSSLHFSQGIVRVLRLIIGGYTAKVKYGVRSPKFVWAPSA
jgi:hypothetical protein